MKTLSLIALASVFVAACSTGAPIRSEAPLAPSLPIRGLDAIPSGQLVLFGEWHGTREIPRFFGDVVEHVAGRAAGPVVVALEIPESEQPRIDAFLSSGGANEDRSRLIASKFWQRERMQDGRSSVAMLELIDRLRPLATRHRELRVVAFDLREESARDVKAIDWEGQMARSLKAVRSETPSASILVLTGNVHARTAAGVPWDPSFLPMGALLARVIPGVVSFNAEYATGSAWACMAEDKCGEHPVKGTDRGPSPFVERSESKSPEGFDGVFYIGGPVSASPPAKSKRGG